MFEPSEPLQLLARAFAYGSSSLYWDVSRLPSRTARAYIVTGAAWEGVQYGPGAGVGLGRWQCVVHASSVPTWRMACIAAAGRFPSAGATGVASSLPLAGIGLLWVGLGGALLLATEFLHDTISLSVYYALAAACVTVGAFTTHGLAGFLRHSEGGSSSGKQGGSGSSASGGWRFWQPFRGGTAFVLAQVRQGSGCGAVSACLP